MQPEDENHVGAENADAVPDDYTYLSPLGHRNRVLAAFEIVENVVSIALVVVIFGTMMLQVISRVVFEPATGTEELARYANIVLCAAAAALAMALRGHITVDLIDRWLNPRLLDALRGATSLFVAIVAAAIVYYSVPYVSSMGARVSVALQIPISALFAVVLVGLALQAFHGLAWAWYDFGSAMKPVAATEEGDTR